MSPNDQKVLNTILDAARWAVSADNGQPWKFRWQDSRLSVLLDSQRSSSFFDGSKYAPYMGVGTLLENLSIAARQSGYEPHMDLFPGLEVDHDQVVASISFTRSTPAASPLFPAIFERTTNRRPYRSTPISPEVRNELMQTSNAFPDFRIVFVDDDRQKNKLARLTAGVESIRFNFSRKDVHADFFPCLRFTKTQAQRAGDGLWVQCLEPGVHGALALRVLSKWPCASIAARLGAHLAFSRQSVHLIRRTPVLALIILSAHQSIPDAYNFVTAGQLSQRLWLVASMHQLACQPMAALPLFFLQHACFGDKGFPDQAGEKTGRLRSEFMKAFDLAPNEHLLMVFRLGYAKPPSARSFRRPLQELIVFNDDSPIAGDIR